MVNVFGNKRDKNEDEYKSTYSSLSEKLLSQRWTQGGHNEIDTLQLVETPLSFLFFQVLELVDTMRRPTEYAASCFVKATQGMVDFRFVVPSVKRVKQMLVVARKGREGTPVGVRLTHTKTFFTENASTKKGWEFCRNVQMGRRLQSVKDDITNIRCG